MSSSNIHESDDEFVVVDDEHPIRPKQSNGHTVVATNGTNIISNTNGTDDTNKASVRLHPIHASEDVLVSINTPLKPDIEPGMNPGDELCHTSCDVVLVIDISGSMGTSAELPDNIGTDKKEFSGLNILDLVKHAARTVLESLNEGDRLAIVTFSGRATRVQGLSQMTLAGKKLAWQRIEKLQPEASTNLWSGICEGLEVFNTTEDLGNVQSMFILTDGEPNYMCPSQGYVKKLQPMLKEMELTNGHAPSLSTFGFGYHLRSDLMRSIAEVGRGSYAFIPDSGMIGTVFVHAVANLFSTFATSVKLHLQIQGRSATVSAPKFLEFETEVNEDGIVINLERLQYGQSSDIIVRVDEIDSGDVISCALEYRNVKKGQEIITAQRRFSDPPTAPQAYIDYHLLRHRLCDFIARFSTRNKNNEHAVLPSSKVHKQLSELKPLINYAKNRITAARKAQSSAEGVNLLQSILADIENQDEDVDANPHGAGQISLALQTTKPSSTKRIDVSFYDRWGKHYLPSVLHAHMRQQCATFKDPGPLCYGSKSPLFIKCRDALDAAFDKLPAPKPSLKGQNVEGGILRMSRYNSRSNPCFAGHCEVRTAYGGSGYELRVDELRVGDIVWTPAGGRMVQGIVKTDVTLGESQIMCNFSEGNRSDGGLWITPYHPIQLNGKWSFPINVVQTEKPIAVMKTGYIYSIILEKDEDANAHVMHIGGVLCATLGHGMTSATSENNGQEIDARVHPYLGNYDRVLGDIELLDKDDCGRRVSGGIVREGGGKFATRFLRPDELQTSGHYVRAHL